MTAEDRRIARIRREASRAAWREFYLPPDQAKLLPGTRVGSDDDYEPDIDEILRRHRDGASDVEDGQ